MDILCHYIIAHSSTGARERAELWLIFLARLAGEILEYDIADRERRRVFETECEIRLSIALIDFDCIVDVINEHSVVGDVGDSACSTASLEISAECSWGVRPDFDACTVLVVFSQS